MNENHILTIQNGEMKIEYLIERVIRMDSQIFFTIFNLTSGEVMFGEFLGELPEDEEQALDTICDDFRAGCKHITYPDGYIVDDLYEMVDFY